MSGQSVSVDWGTVTLTAKSDMSTGGPAIDGSYRYTAVKIDTSADFTCEKAGNGDPSVGVLVTAPVAGKAATVQVAGIAQMIVDGTTPITPGDYLAVDASGRGVKTTTDKAKSIGRALQASSAANDRIAVLLNSGLTLSL